MLNREVKVHLFDILSLVNCSDTYGFTDDVLMDALAELTGYVSDEEIESYARNTFLSEAAEEHGYTEEDYEEAIRNITLWRNTYCK